MMILSQDKNTIINMDQVFGIHARCRRIECYPGGSEDPFYIGVYESDSRCKEIIDDILHGWGFEPERMMPNGSVGYISHRKVYVMPEE